MNINLMLSLVLFGFLILSQSSISVPPPGTTVVDKELIYPTVKRTNKEQRKNAAAHVLPTTVNALMLANHARPIRAVTAVKPTKVPTKLTIKADEPLPFLEPSTSIRDVHLVKKFWGRHSKHPSAFHVLGEKYRDANNTYSVQPHASVFSTREEGVDYDYYHIGLASQFSPSLLLDQRKFFLLGHHPILASSYSVDAYPIYYNTGVWHKIDEAPALLTPLEILENWSPQPQPGQTTHVNSTGVQLEGQVSWAGAGQPAASVGMNVQVIHSKERTIPDEAIFPHIGENGHARWDYKFNNLTTKQEGGNSYSRSSISTYSQWIWKINRAQAIANDLYYDGTPAGQPQGTGPFYFNFGFDVTAGFRKVYSVPLKTVKSSERTYEIINFKSAIAGRKKMISIKVPDELPANCSTVVYVL